MKNKEMKAKMITSMVGGTENKENSLAKMYPDIAAEWDYDANGDLVPGQIGPESRRKVWWVCANGHRWAQAISSRTAYAKNKGKRNDCPYCNCSAVIK